MLLCVGCCGRIRNRFRLIHALPLCILFLFPFFRKHTHFLWILYETNKNNERNKIFLVSFPPCHVLLDFIFLFAFRLFAASFKGTNVWIPFSHSLPYETCELFEIWISFSSCVFAFLHMSGFSFLPCCDTSPSHQEQRNTFLTENFNITWARVRKFSFIFFPPVFFILATNNNLKNSTWEDKVSACN